MGAGVLIADCGLKMEAERKIQASKVQDPNWEQM